MTDDLDNQPAKVSRRGLLTAAAAAGSGAAALAGRAQAAATVGSNVNRGSQAGRKFRAFVVDGTEAGVREMRLLPVQPREVVVRVEAAPACISLAILARAALKLPLAPGFPSTGPALASGSPSILGHCSVGVVEAVGDMVRRVRPGDRVLVPGTPQCGQCYQCLRGRSDWCQFMGTTAEPLATLDDGKQVIPGLHLGGLGEMTVVVEEYCVPVFTDLPPAQLAMLADCAGIGMAAGMNLAPIEPGSDVVIFGCGPLGLGSVQAARIVGAAQIIAIEPVKARREAALKLGATLALDPNVEGDSLVRRLRELCKGKTDRWNAGGRRWDPTIPAGEGADFTIEAVGGDIFAPKVESGPDPTGITPMKQALAATRAGGQLTYMGVQQRGELSFAPAEIANAGRTIHAGQMGGMHVMRDLPRYVRLAEKGSLDLASMVTMTRGIDGVVELLTAAAQRTTIGAIAVFNS